MGEEGWGETGLWGSLTQGALPQVWPAGPPREAWETPLPSLTKEEEQVFNRVTAGRALAVRLAQSPCFTEGETEAWRGWPSACAHTEVSG